MKLLATTFLSIILLFIGTTQSRASYSEYQYWETFGQYVPFVSAGFLGCFGVEAKDKFPMRVLKIGTSMVTEGIIVKGLKLAINEERPDGSSDNSFPSGHTATAFNGAELVRYEYGTWWGLGAYTLATAVGLSRVYHKRHYIWDVGAGALFGVLSARIGIQTISLIKEKRDQKKNNLNVSFSPVFYDNGAKFVVTVDL